jgi:hypothetical protein
LTSLEDRYKWKNTTAGSEEREDQLKAERKEYETRLILLRDNQKNVSVLAEKSQTIYEFYNSLIPIKTKWIQFIFQTLLSGFIAFMSPLGIITYKRKEHQIIKADHVKVVKQATDAPHIRRDSPDDRFIRRWLQINWLGVEKEKSDSILPIETFKTFMENRNESYAKVDYDYVLNRAIECKIIDKNHKIIEKNPICDKVYKVDGIGDFLWKPEGENNKKLVVLFPIRFQEQFEKVTILDKNDKEVELKFAGFANPHRNKLRQHWRGDKPASAYPKKQSIKAYKKGNVCKWTIDNAWIRQD